MLAADSPDVQNQKKPQITLHFINASLTWVIRLLFALFFFQCVVVLLTRYSPPRSPGRTTSIVSISAAVNKTAEECPYGRVYVYDLPSRFNKGLLARGCRNSNSDRWQCEVATNHGFGRLAEELRGIMPENLIQSWYRTNQFSLEVIFHHRILRHRCRTRNPASAAAFYIPFYAGMAVEQYLWSNDLPRRDRRCRMLLKWLRKKQYRRRSDGSDHFLTLGRITWDFRRPTRSANGWGSAFLNMPAMQNVTRIIIEKATWDPLELGAPYPTGFHPKTLTAVAQWQDFVRTRTRTRLFTFIGATRPSAKEDLRGHLRSHCLNYTDSCWLVDCAAVRCDGDSSATVEALLGSDFCLQPAGDSFTRKSVFDCMLAGSVPVFFWTGTAYDQYEGFLPEKPESFSVFIDHGAVWNGTSPVKNVLMKYGKEEILRMREKVIETIIPRIIYGDPMGGLLDFRDGFDLALERVLKRIATS
ncbi:xyloglucan galactosyltransferase XLT2-like [Andrographis paniculata]|uniref:xyloglucan galactosyltransferase XLT2-like n=1 Tax=Andrographis paniculata TaxID=175694 RepID=UPI0021E9AE14|nr:xyloglucan galactosyltransferase XLT2-like [Andrographis paniculata]